MLKLDLNLTKEQKNIRLNRIRNNFAKYFGFVSSGDIAEALSLQQAINTQRATEPSELGPQAQNSSQTVSARANLVPDRNATPIFNILLDPGSGAMKALQDFDKSERDRSIKGRLTTLGAGSDQAQIMKRYVEMHYCSGVPGYETTIPDVFHADLEKIGFSDQSKEVQAKNKLSVFRMKHPLLAPGEKNADLLTVFFNAFPTIELTRATPVLNVKMYSSRQVFQDGKLAAISLHKFLEGAVNVPSENPKNSAIRAMSLANQVTSSLFSSAQEDVQNYSLAGMELFQATQTMVNPDSAKVKENFLAPIIDPFRPLASIKSFDVDVKSAVGLISTKTAKLEIVLHDRSRLGEFADIVKPDRYGQSFIDVEYGWSHPDQLDAENPYADLLNLTRAQEHYNIVNSSFSFDEVGQVNITLNLVTRGSSEATELSITGEVDAVKNQLKDMERLSREINRLSAIVYGNSSATTNGSNQQHRSEIRGQQMLGAAGDSTNFLLLNGELLTSLRGLRSSLNDRQAHTNSSSSRRVADASRELAHTIDQLVGAANSRPTRPDSQARPATPTTPPAAGAHTPARSGGHSTQVVGGALSRVQESVNRSIHNSLMHINPTARNNNYTTEDIFFNKMPQTQREIIARHTNRLVARDSTTAQRAEQAERPQIYGSREDERGVLNRIPVISLGTLFMNFVAKPLAMMEDKFEEVQVYFYNFNNKASHMSHCNISQFPIYTDFFAREYSRLRLENMNRAVNLSVLDFITFIANRMVDDSMNPAYGINDLYKISRDGHQLEINTQGRSEQIKQDNFNRQMRERMEQNNIGHSPDFQVPQITVDLEAAPYAYEENKTILKIHVYDRTCSSTSPLRELLSLSTENLMSELSAFPADNGAAADAESDQAVNQVADNNTMRSSRINRENSRNRTRPRSVNNSQPQITDDALRQAWRESYNIVINQATQLGLIETINTNSSQNGSNGIQSVRPQYRFKGGPKRLKEMVMNYLPHIIYGCMGTTVKTANLSTQQNAQLATINMLRSTNADPVLANGEQAGGVPLSVYPCELSLTTLGCPIVRYSQEIFVDFNTNTTADNIYFVTGLQHRIEPGRYETTIKLTPNDAFGQYRNMISQLNAGGNYIRAATNSTTSAQNSTPASSGTSSPSNTPNTST